ncbi:ATP-binding protein [Micromonospora sp. S-DT3-3-22]|uniref:ATP-binding protein n=1 Tax=Micromonospora sp. S-DT3-3-22 TaxID=2755359 RepID=UPI00189084B1|nr:ATP-binding protein [Micromonospora sp. S-DT3-3-22]
MTGAEHAALAALRFDWAPVPDDVWRPSPFHVEGLHSAVVRDILDGVADARHSADSSPIGLVLQGQRGSGKTHLLGWIRQQVQQQDGYFFLVGLLDAHGFWDSVLAAVLDGLSRPVPGGESQLRLLLRRLSSLVGAPRSARRAVMGETELTRPALDAFVEGLVGYAPHVARVCGETARALALSASEDVAHRDVAENYFTSGEEGEPGERSAWGMRRTPRGPQRIVQEISWLLALTGPSVIAVDQIDTLIAQSVAAGDVLHARPGAQDDPEQAAVHARIADGLMSLRQLTRRTLTLVACLPTSWTIIRSRTVDTVSDRFRVPPRLTTIHDPALARRIIERRLAVRFAEVGFVPPYPSWPVRPDAFAHAEGMTPRELLIDIDRHIRDCLAAGEVRELTRLGDPTQPQPHSPRGVPAADLEPFDKRFAQLKNEADVSGPLTRDGEDGTVPALLAAGLTAWVVERGEGGGSFSVDPPPSAQPPLHARLRLTLDEATEDQVHWCFRAISEEHHAIAALARLRKACTVAGLDARVARRRLFLLRNGAWSGGAKTRQAVTAFTRAGGTILPLDHGDLRILGALRVMLAESPVDIRGWLTARQPTRDLTVLRQALASVADWLPAAPGDDTAGRVAPSGPGGAGRTDAGCGRPGPGQVDPLPAGAAESGPRLTVGYDHRTDEPVSLPLEALRKHTTIFAGSGSGKTVLIRRVLEECALAGVSAIVLDPNNDLARLGDGWPEPPPQWRAGDAGKARDYLAGTDVLVWTPRRSSGRPLSFQPLPDFRSVRDDPDEFHEAVEAAVASLAPRAQLTGRTNKVHLGLAVLRKAVEHYGRRGGSRVQGLIDTLADLPDGLLDIDGADKIGVGIAQSLAAAMVNDPLFGGEGSPMDPGLLLTPAPGARARISVVSLVGLQSDETRQGFVNQLQMALFAWIRKHPANDRPLLGLLVMDEAQTFAPSGAMTPCTQSTLALAAQARKYGLGLVFATQAPKGLHNRIPGNAATQLYGRLNSPIQIEAAREMAKAKGGDIADVARLGTGEFYLAAEGAAPVKIRTPLSLSHHPRSPLTAEEVLERARRR